MTVRKTLFKQAVDAMRPVAVCPVTAGLPTRLTRDGFAAACAGYIKKATEKRGPARFQAKKYAYCLECNGRIKPKELQIISMQLLKKEYAENGGGKMGNTKTVAGKCEVCGREKGKVQKNNGVMACSRCTTLQGFVNRNPDVVVQEMVRLGKGHHFKEYVNPEDDPLYMVVIRIRAALNRGDGVAFEDIPDPIVDLVERENTAAVKMFDTENALRKLQDDFDDLKREYDDQAKVIDGLCDEAIPTDLVRVADLVGDNKLLSAVNTLAGEIQRVRLTPF